MSSSLSMAPERLKPKLHNTFPERILGLKNASALRGYSEIEKFAIARAQAPAREARALARAESVSSVTDHLTMKRAAIDAGEFFSHCRGQQCDVRDFTEVFGDEPDRFFCGHPVQMIEPRKVHRARIPPQCAFAAQVEVDIEITHGQLAQAAVNRFAITAAGEIRFRYRAPVPAHFENRDNMVGVLFRFQIENQGWESQNAERGRSENSAFKT